MSKKSISFFIAMFLVLASLNLVLAAECNIQVTLFNQDPDPVMPGEYVEVVFQMSGLDNMQCGGAWFEIVPEYPFSLDESEPAKKELPGNTYTKDYSKVWNIPYKIRIDEDALEGERTLETRFAAGKSPMNFSSTKDFDITIEDLRVDFEISVQSYDPQTQELTFEILNIGEHDIDALTIEIPSQKNIEIKGSPRTIVGKLDKNEETTFDFTAIPSKGDIKLDILYTDEINERRSLEKSVDYEPSYFENSQEQNQQISIWFYLFLVLLVLVIGKWLLGKRKHKRKKK